MIEASPALRAREEQILVGYTRSLAELIAEEAAPAPTTCGRGSPPTR